MEVGISLQQLKDVGKQDSFRRHWPYIDVKAWPGRELHWAWCHPFLSLVLFVTAAIVIVGVFSGGA